MSSEIFYHGSSSQAFHGYREQGGHSDEQDMLFMSRSANVARRYGTVYALHYEASALPVITVEEWFCGQSHHGSFLIQGDGGYDFPVDTLVLREDPANSFVLVPSPDELDDGLAIVHDPTSAEDRQFEQYIEEHYDGDFSSWESDVECGRSEKASAQ